MYSEDDARFERYADVDFHDDERLSQPALLDFEEEDESPARHFGRLSGSYPGALVGEAHGIQGSAGKPASLGEELSEAEQDEPFVERPAKASGRLFRALFGTIGNTRRLHSVLLFAALFVVYALRVNLSVAIKPMKNEYGWSQRDKGFVLSSFFWGYFMLQVPGGWLSTKAAAWRKHLLGWGVLLTALLSILLPLVAAHDITGVAAVRFSIGFVEGVTFPALSSLLACWFPKSERAASAGFVWSGAYLGTAVAFPVCGLITGKDEFDTTHWPWVFYGPGLLGVLWWLFWEVFTASFPEEHWAITRGEVDHIQNSDARAAALLAAKGGDASEFQEPLLLHAGDLEQSSSGSGAGSSYGSGASAEEGPALSSQEKAAAAAAEMSFWSFLALAKSPAFWAPCLSHMASKYAFYMLLTELPTFLNEQLDYDIKDAGIVSVIPYLATFAAALLGGRLSDWLVTKRNWRTRTVRVSAGLSGLVLCGVVIVLAGFVNDRTLVVTMLTLAVAGSGFTSVSYAANYIDVLPQHAGLIMGVGNTLASLAGMLAPIITAALVEDVEESGDYEKNKRQWRNVFYTCAGLSAAVSLFVLAFTSGKPISLNKRS